MALVTGISGGGAFVRISRWLIKGFNEIGVPFDAVYLEGPSGITNIGIAREVRLGTHFARRSIKSLASYLAQARPQLTLVSPEFLAPYALLAGRLAGAAVVPWEASFVNFGRQDLPLRKRLLPILQFLTYRSAP
ncbi:MAG: hypothetical protein ABR575_10520, partial [Actinomycetota bacterium]